MSILLGVVLLVIKATRWRYLIKESMEAYRRWSSVIGNESRTFDDFFQSIRLPGFSESLLVFPSPISTLVDEHDLFTDSD